MRHRSVNASLSLYEHPCNSIALVSQRLVAQRLRTALVMQLREPTMLPNESWARLEKSMALKAAIEDANVIFASDDDALAKQKNLKIVVEAYELARSLFQAVDMEIESDTDNDDADKVVTETHAALERVMRLEFENATHLVTTEKWTQGEDNSFLDSDASVLLAFARAKAQVYCKKHVFESMDADKDASTTTSVQAELIMLEKTVLKQSSVVKKAKKDYFLRDRQRRLASPKRNGDENLRPDTSSTQEASKRRRNGDLNLATSPAQSLASDWPQSPKKQRV